MKIRTVTSDDLSSVYAIDHIAGSDLKRKGLISNAINDQCAWLVESSDGHTVGYGILSHDFFGRSFIELIYIDERHRSKGYGSAVIRYLEQKSRSDDLFTSTNESNAHMQHVLTNLGYERSGTIFNLDPGDPELIYVKKSVRT
jgi:ribosomal protein S18 acetylase RimI-like enzyme